MQRTEHQGLRRRWKKKIDDKFKKNMNRVAGNCEKSKSIHYRHRRRRTIPYKRRMDIFDKIKKKPKSREIAIQPDTKVIWSTE